MSKTKLLFRMCTKDMPYIQKFCGGCVIIMIVIIIIMCVYIGTSANGSEAKVEMSGNQDEAVIQQSSGVHLFEVNGSNLGSKECNCGWSWIEIICVVLVFVFILKCTHIAHYCLLTKK